METKHKIFVGDSRNMAQVESGSVDLVVTSPPYPMIEMWDDLFSELNKNIRELISSGEGSQAFDLMHEELDKTWSEVVRVLKPGGLVVINIGDATRKNGGEFKLYPNHSRVVDFFREQGFSVLPDILWRKKTNKANKFMGSGMLPPNAYVSLEHEFLLIFRKGTKRKLKPKSEKRYQSAYFWEERNQWFSDLWEGVGGVLQNLNHNKLRERAASYPLEIPYRLINMFSIYGDTVLDPFWGTGTTSLAAMVLGRDSIGYEIKKSFTEVFHDRVKNAKVISKKICEERIKRHLAFENEKDQLNYEAKNYDFKVITKQERRICFYNIDKINKEKNVYNLQHEKYDYEGFIFN